MLQVTTGREPVYLGKPAPEMVFCAQRTFGFSPEKTIVVGDRLYTDIACGINAGVDTALLLCGEATLADLETTQYRPTRVLADPAALYAELLTEKMV